MRGLQESSIYATWAQPWFAPPAWLFGPVWSVLYLIIAISFGYVFYQVYRGQLPKSVAVPFILNLIANALFTPIQFGLQNFLLAAIDIVVVWVTILWMMRVIWPHVRWVAYVQIPYLLWVSFATVLQLTVTYLNW
jgi:benzodiazapine receptor